MDDVQLVNMPLFYDTSVVKWVLHYELMRFSLVARVKYEEYLIEITPLSNLRSLSPFRLGFSINSLSLWHQFSSEDYFLHINRLLDLISMLDRQVGVRCIEHLFPELSLV